VSSERTELRVTLAAGVSRCGKTIFFLRYLVTLLARAAGLNFTAFIFDPLGLMAEQLGLTAAETPEELELAMEDGIVLYDSSVMFPGDQARGFDYFCQWSYVKACALPGRKALLCDEIWKFQNQHKVPHWLACWIQDGAKFGCEVCLATHDPHLMHSSIKGQITEIVGFYLQGEKQLAYVRDLGLDPDEIQSLPNGAFVSRNVRSRGEIRARLW
jgi:hypothetical protein